jgi:hypothetical protein
MHAAVENVKDWLVDLVSSDTADDVHLSDQQKEELEQLLPWTRAVTEVSAPRRMQPADSVSGMSVLSGDS